jgi:hypothetical protein
MLKNEEVISGGAMLSRGGQKPQHRLSFLMPANGRPVTKSHGEGGGCTHCGNTKHTKDTCFKIHGYPDWWHELKAKKKPEARCNEHPGRAALISMEPTLSLVPAQESPIPAREQTDKNDPSNQGYVFCSQKRRHDHDGWIIDSGATDHMTYDPCDLSDTTQPKRLCIANANGVTYPMTGAGTVALSPSF